MLPINLVVRMSDLESQIHTRIKMQSHREESLAVDACGRGGDVIRGMVELLMEPSSESRQGLLRRLNITHKPQGHRLGQHLLEDVALPRFQCQCSGLPWPSQEGAVNGESGLVAYTGKNFGDVGAGNFHRQSPWRNCCNTQAHGNTHVYSCFMKASMHGCILTEEVHWSDGLFKVFGTISGVCGRDTGAIPVSEFPS